MCVYTVPVAALVVKNGQAQLPQGDVEASFSIEGKGRGLL